MSFARRGFRFLLAALLVFSQQQAGLHLLGHALAQVSVASAGLATRPDSNDPQELVCAKCLAVAHLDHALNGTVPTFAAVRSAPERVATVVAVPPELAFFARYRSRAPPALA